MRQAPIAVNSSGTIRVRVMDKPLPIGARVRFRVPTRAQFGRDDWFSHKDDQYAKIMLYADPVECASEYSALTRDVADFFKAPGPVMQLLRGIPSESNRAHLPMFTLPDSYYKLIQVAGLAWVYHFIASGMLTPTSANATGGSYRSSSVGADGEPWESRKRTHRFQSMNFNDAFRYTTAAGGNVFPMPGATADGDVQTFGRSPPIPGGSAAGGTGETLNAASDWVIQISHILGLTTA